MSPQRAELEVRNADEDRLVAVASISDLDAEAGIAEQAVELLEDGLGDEYTVGRRV